MKRSLSTASLTAFLVLLFAITASAQLQSKGKWSIDRNSKTESGKVHLSMHHEDKDNFGNDIAISELKGFSPSSFDNDGPAKFQLVREAGTVDFEGAFYKGMGQGFYTFTANPEYVSKLKQMGFTGIEKEALSLVMIDVTIDYAKELQSLGFHPTLDKVIEGRIFKVNREQVEGLQAVGFAGLSLDKLVECRIFNVTPEYIREMKAKNPNITLDQLVEAHIFKATPEFAEEMAKAGYPNLTQEQLVAFRIHNVTPAYITQLRELGFKDLNADKLVEFKIFNVGADQIRDLSSAGYKDLTAEQLVAFRIHNIDSKFIEKVKKAGYSHPSPDQLVEFRIMGIRKAEADI
jgi:hypothetical protein